MLSALDLARRIDAGELSPAAVVDLCVKAIDAREAEIGAFTTLDLGGARLRAQSDALARTPLRGLPVGVKDIIDTADLPTEWGTPIHRGRQARRDAACVALSRKAGGILLGKTVTTEFANLHPGPTRNPHDAARTPGRSSSPSTRG